MLVIQHPVTDTASAMIVLGAFIVVASFFEAYRRGPAYLIGAAVGAGVVVLALLVRLVFRGAARRRSLAVLSEVPFALAGVVQANNSLFQPGPEVDCAPGVLVYALDPRYALDPGWAQGAATFLASVRSQMPNDPELMRLHFELNNEKEYFSIELPPRLMNGVPAMVTVALLDRYGLPGGMIPQHRVVFAGVRDSLMGKLKIYGLVPWKVYG